jgi:hypothetical protein
MFFRGRCATLSGMDKYNPATGNLPSVPADHRLVYEAAANRANYLLWLAEKIMISSDITLRRTVARELRQLAEGK